MTFMPTGARSPATQSMLGVGSCVVREYISGPILGAVGQSASPKHSGWLTDVRALPLCKLAHQLFMKCQRGTAGSDRRLPASRVKSTF
jgi:hypothetical protein